MAYAKLTAQGKMMLSAKVPLRQLRIRDVPDDGDKRYRFEMLIDGGKSFPLSVSLLFVPRIHVCQLNARHPASVAGREARMDGRRIQRHRGRHDRQGR